MDHFFHTLWSGFSKAYNGFEGWLTGLFGFSGRQLPIESIADRIDPRFVPQVPMSGEQIDVSTRMEMSQHGFKHAKLVTPQSHPELSQHWNYLCKRAGFDRPLQLILCESDIPNAFAVSDSEMGFTTGLLQHLTYREVIAVLSHELGHANNFEKQQGMHAATAGGLSLLGFGLPWIGKDFNMSDGWHQSRNRLLASLAGSTVGQITGSKISGYSSELEADLEGAVISRDPEALVSALTKLEGESANADIPSWRRVLGKIASVHPPTEERVKWLREIKRELDSKAPMNSPHPSLAGPAPRIAADQAEVERVSTNLPETAISGA